MQSDVIRLAYWVQRHQQTVGTDAPFPCISKGLVMRYVYGVPFGRPRRYQHERFETNCLDRTHPGYPAAKAGTTRALGAMTEAGWLADESPGGQGWLARFFWRACRPSHFLTESGQALAETLPPWSAPLPGLVGHARDLRLDERWSPDHPARDVWDRHFQGHYPALRSMFAALEAGSPPGPPQERKRRRPPTREEAETSRRGLQLIAAHADFTEVCQRIIDHHVEKADTAERFLAEVRALLAKYEASPPPGGNDPESPT